MQVLGSKENPVPLLAPGICIVCEHSPTQIGGERVIDTERTFIPNGPPTRLNGRKYVCTNCVKEMGRLVGMEFTSEAAHARAELDTLRAFQARLGARIKDFANDVANVAAQIPDAQVSNDVQGIGVGVSSDAGAFFEDIAGNEPAPPATEAVEPPPAESVAGASDPSAVGLSPQSEQEVAEAANTEAEVSATPAAAVAAEEKGVDLTQVEGTGKDGTVVKSDVEKFQTPAELFEAMSKESN